MRTLSLLIFTLFCTISAIAQPWIGPDAGNIYHNQGNVGIGTTSPGSLGTSITTLQIVGGSTNPSTRSGGWRLTSYDASLDAYGYFANSILYMGTGSNHDMSLLTNGVERLTILKGGNVGIGTTSPGYPLHLYKASAETGILTSWGGSNIYLSHGGWGIGAGKFGIGNGSTPTIVFDTNTNNVGIGTNDPAGYALYVKNSNPTIRLSSVAETDGLTQEFILGTPSYNRSAIKSKNFGTTGGSDLSLWTSPNNSGGSSLERVTILNNGNVGIGTTTPEAKLTVKGKIVASEIQVKDMGAIPDYVFKPDYQLMSLEKVEEFVKQNQHLPEVPSEKEFKKDGMNVAEMNALLLKKIEELTLYAIKQNKKVEALTVYSSEQNKKTEEQALYSIEQNKSLKEQAKKIEALEKAMNNLISK